MPFSEYFKAIQRKVDVSLDNLTPNDDTYPPQVHEAMRYSLFAGGKRLRPMLAVAACELVGGKADTAFPFAAALEMIHTYTLIHDDLPAIDNDEMRRGVPTNHIKFGEATAILAGDALLTLAFETITNATLFPGVPADTLLAVANDTAVSTGSLGTIGGQMVDIISENAEPDYATLEYIHSHKTGKLITLAVRGGATLGGAEGDQLEAVVHYGRHMGLAFQIVDDVLDVEGDDEKLGKTTGSDTRKKKMTYPSVAGLEESKKRAAELTDEAIAALDMFGPEAGHLRDLAKYVIARSF